MKILKTVLITVVFAFCLSLESAYAEDTKVSGSASVDIMSNYVWRGFKLSKSIVIQPSAGITYSRFGANLWANYDTDTNEHNETDLTLNYNFKVNKFSFDAGYIYYALDSADDTQEIYLSAGYDMLFNPALTVYYDFDEGDGAFVTASIGHDIELAKDTALSLGALISYNLNSKYSIGDYSGFHNAEISASTSIPLWNNISVGPMVAYSFPLSNDAKDAFKSASDDGDKSIFYGGINFTLSF